MKLKKYTALIIDLKKSKKYSSENRNYIQEYIFHMLEVLNGAFRRSLEKDVSFSAGDEVQGLFSSVEASYLYFRLFSMLIAPIEIRAGIGVGDWDVVIDKAGTTAQDGSAYHNARFAINATEESLGYSVLLFSGSKNDIVVNSLFNSTAVIINKQSEYQNEVMLLSELLYPINFCDLIDENKLSEIVHLLEHKDFVSHLNASRLFYRTKEPLFYRVQGRVLDIRSVDYTDNKSFFITTGKVRGLPLQLADILGISRQSIDKTIKAANIYEARNLAVATLMYLSELMEE